MFGCILEEAHETNLLKYRNLREFFTRKLKHDARAIHESPLVSWNVEFYITYSLPTACTGTCTKVWNLSGSRALRARLNVSKLEDHDQCFNSSFSL